MIVCCLRGGMGNQLHEYAFARYLASLSGQDVGLNASFYDPTNANNPGRGYELGAFSCATERMSFENWMAKAPIEVNSSVVEYISEADISMPDLIASFAQREKTSCALVGFWQDHWAFLEEPEIHEILQREFSPRVPIDPAELDVSLRPIFNSETSVSLHVRRGDYLKHSYMWNTLGRAYYKDALDLIQQTVKTPDIFVFSDDVKQVKSENLFDLPVTYVETGSLHTDFHLFRSCRHNIIANSTFSWWAAYLNANPSKQIVAPKIYYADPTAQAAYEANPRVHSGWHMV